MIVKPAQDTFWGGYAGYFQDTDKYLWQRQSPHYAARRGRSGCVVNVSSHAGVRRKGASIPYAATKAALNRVTRMLALWLPFLRHTQRASSQEPSHAKPKLGFRINSTIAASINSG